MEFQHFIITPFNLKNYPKAIYDDERWLAWTKKRIGIFNTYCFSSITNQSTRNFVWLIYLDIGTPDDIREQLPVLDDYPHIHYVFADGFPDFIDRYKNDMRSMCRQEVEWIVSSRFDNDDCMHRQAIETIQKKIQPVDEYMVSLVSGYVYNIHLGKLSHYYYPNSPFISLVENRQKQELKGIFHLLNHCAWPPLKFYLSRELKHPSDEVCFVTDPILWMQIYHEENISNSFYRGVPVLKKRDLSDFGLQQRSKASSLAVFVHYRSLYYWKLYIKICIYRLKSKLSPFLKKIIDIRRHYYYQVDKSQPLSFPNPNLYTKAITPENCRDIQEYYPNLAPKFCAFVEQDHKGLYGYIDGQLVAYAWAILNNRDTSKKIRGFFPLPSNAACVHFCRVMDNFRGRKIYQTMLAHMYICLYRVVNDIYLDTETTNRPANQAVKKSNGEVIGQLTRVICLGYTVMTFKRMNDVYSKLNNHEREG